MTAPLFIGRKKRALDGWFMILIPALSKEASSVVRSRCERFVKRK